MKKKKVVQQKSAKKWIYNILIGICLTVFVVCGVILFYHYYAYYQAGETKSHLKGQLGASLTESEREQVPMTVRDKLAKLYTINEDIVGWIKIDGTDVDYPVVQAEDNNKYLKTDFNGKYHRLGTVFAHYQAEITPERTSDNIVIFGHSANNGEFFSPLLNYKTLKYYQKHPIIHFDTLYEEADWVILGAFMTDALYMEDDAFRYYSAVEFPDDASYENFFREMDQRTYFHTGIEHDRKDKYITLSTCDYELKEGRIGVVARKLRKGEKPEDFDTSKAYVNVNRRMPDAWYEKNGMKNPFAKK